MWRIAIVLLLASAGTASSGAEDSALRELRVLTYNVLADPVEADARVAALSRIMEESRADIIALQEVAPWFARRLLQEPWAQSYARAQQAGRTVIAHEFLILSRFPVLAHHTAPLIGPQRRVLHRVDDRAGGSADRRGDMSP